MRLTICLMRLTAKKHSQPKKLLQSCRLEHNENGVLTAAIKSSEPIGGDVYGISGIYCSSPKNRAFIKKKSFADWTSKAKLILSGHCHCDRLNTSTLIPDGNGNYLRGDTSYAIAYTASASRFGGKSESTYYYPCFGKDGQIASWEYNKSKSRVSGTIEEQLMDVWIVSDNRIKRIRFGAGKNSPLLSTEVELPE